MQPKLSPRLPVAVVATIGLVLVAASPVRGDHESQHGSYVIVESSGSGLMGGTTEIGLQGDDDAVVEIALPFDFVFYGELYEADDPLYVSSNGNIQFTVDPVLGASIEYPYSTDDDDDCLPDDQSPTDAFPAPFEGTVFGLWADARDLPDDGNGGVFTAVYGTAPNRTFVIEWRTEWINSEEDVNFEIILYERNSLIRVVYGDIGDPGVRRDDEESRDIYLIGVQASQSGPWSEYACNLDDDVLMPAPPAGTVVDFIPTVINFSSDSYSVDEDAGTATITAVRTGVLNGEVSVDYETTALTATAGTDYTESSGTLTFGHGEDTATFTVPIENDTADEPDETVDLELSPASAGVFIGDTGSAMLTILDDDAATGTASPTPGETAGTAPPTPTRAASPSGRGLPNTSSTAETPAAVLLVSGAILVASLGLLAAASGKQRSFSR